MNIRPVMRSLRPLSTLGTRPGCFHRWIESPILLRKQPGRVPRVVLTRCWIATSAVQAQALLLGSGIEAANVSFYWSRLPPCEPARKDIYSVHASGWMLRGK